MKKILCVVFLLFVTAYDSVFISPVANHSIVTQFGEIKRVIKKPGLYYKLPFVQDVMFLNSKKLLYQSKAQEFLTRDKKNIVVSTYIIWEIADSVRFYQSVGTREGAESRIGDVVSSEVGASFGLVPFKSLVNIDPKEIKLNDIAQSILKNCENTANRDFGIHIVDVRIFRLNFPDQNKESVFQRMRMERKKISSKYRSEGEEEATKIKADADLEKEKTIAQARKEAKEIEGRGEAESTRIYNETISKYPQTYRFLRTIEAYKKFLGQNSTIVIPSDSSLMQYLQENPEKKKNEK